MRKRRPFPVESQIPTRYSLLSRLQDWEDQDSWKDFFDTYWQLIYSVAIKARLSDAEAQDVVQETVISVAKHIHKFKKDRARGTFKGWLRNIIRWRIADQFEKRIVKQAPAGSSGARTEPALALGNIPAPEAVLEEIWEQEWQTNLFETAIQRVKQQVRTEHFWIFDLYVLKGWSVLKVTRKLGVSVGQVYLVKHRVSALIRKEIRALEKQLL